MSQPLRFRPANPAHEMVFSPDGNWIAYGDYQQVESENARLKAEVERLTKAATAVDGAWSIYENGLIETPEWVKRSQVRDAISRLLNAAKEGKGQP